MFSKPSALVDSDAIVNVFTKHAQTLRPATDENVRGDFTGSPQFETSDFKASMSRENGRFLMSITSENRSRTYQIERVLGTKGVEQYVTTIDGKLYALPVIFDLTERRWVSVRDVESERKTAPFDRLFADWSLECAACHIATDDTPIPDVSLGNLDSNTVLAACGACHAKDLTETFPSLNDLVGDRKKSADLVADHADMIQHSDGNDSNLSAHEYQGILRSACFVQSKSDGTATSGERINCLSCHTITRGMINTKTDEKIITMRACTDCHQQFSSPDMIAEHTRHEANSEAGSCYNCHMPRIAYGHLRLHRTHKIDSDPSAF